MGFKCAPQLLGLVRGEPKKGQRHRANGKAIFSEAGKERYSASETLKRELSHLNQYTGFASGFAAWDAMRKRADSYVTTGKTKDGKPYERALRKDAVVGFALIINPPSEICVDWTDEQYKKFYKDTWDCLCVIEPRIFSDKNLMMTAEHFDEGMIGNKTANDRHKHIFGNTLDQEEHYCGNLIDAKLLATINQKYPGMMRERGWEMDDLDTTDWERYKQDEDYRSERKAKSRKSGKSVNAHIKADIAKKTKQVQGMNVEIQNLTEQGKSLTSANVLLSDLNENLTVENENLNLDVSSAKTEMMQLKIEKSILQKQNSSLKQEQAALKKKKDSLNEELYDVGLQLVAAKQELAEKEASQDRYEIRAKQNKRFEEMLQRLQNADFIHTFLRRLGIRKWKDSKGKIHQKSYLDLYEEALQRFITGYREEADVIRRGEDYQYQLEKGSNHKNIEYSL